MIVVIFGPGGVGKGTVVQKLVEQHPEIWLSRSWTTRPQRPGEADDAYTFVDRKTFLHAVERGRFLEFAQFNDHLYGTPWPDVQAGQDVLLEIEIQGARQVRDREEGAVLIMLVAPARDIYEARMRARGDSEEQIQRRLEIGAREEAEGRKIADYVVVNDDLGRAVGEVAGIVAARRRAS